jgi:hypothetical protein
MARESTKGKVGAPEGKKKVARVPFIFVDPAFKPSIFSKSSLQRSRERWSCVKMGGKKRN